MADPATAAALDTFLERLDRCAVVDQDFTLIVGADTSQGLPCSTCIDGVVVRTRHLDVSFCILRFRCMQNDIRTFQVVEN